MFKVSLKLRWARELLVALFTVRVAMVNVERGDVVVHYRSRSSPAQRAITVGGRGGRGGDAELPRHGKGISNKFDDEDEKEEIKKKRPKSSFKMLSGWRGGGKKEKGGFGPTAVWVLGFIGRCCTAGLVFTQFSFIST